MIVDIESVTLSCKMDVYTSTTKIRNQGVCNKYCVHLLELRYIYTRVRCRHGFDSCPTGCPCVASFSPYSDNETVTIQIGINLDLFYYISSLADYEDNV